jgi:cell division protease FtsH
MSIIPTTKGAGGFVMPKGRPKKGLKNKKFFLNSILVSLGGRVAEELKFGKENITTGASSDLENASDTITAMTLRYAMFEEVSMFSAKSFNDVQMRGGEEQAKIHRFMEDKLKASQQEVREILGVYSSVLDDIKSALIKEKMVFEQKSEEIIKNAILREGLPLTLKGARKLINNDIAETEKIEKKVKVKV